MAQPLAVADSDGEPSDICTGRRHGGLDGRSQFAKANDGGVMAAVNGPACAKAKARTLRGWTSHQILAVVAPGWQVRYLVVTQQGGGEERTCMGQQPRAASLAQTAQASSCPRRGVWLWARAESKEAR